MKAHSNGQEGLSASHPSTNLQFSPTRAADLDAFRRGVHCKPNAYLAWFLPEDTFGGFFVTRAKLRANHIRLDLVKGFPDGAFYRLSDADQGSC